MLEASRTLVSDVLASMGMLCSASIKARFKSESVSWIEVCFDLLCHFISLSWYLSYILRLRDDVQITAK